MSESQVKKPTPCVKVTLSSGKVVFLRELTISDTEMAAQMVAPKAEGDSSLLQLFMQKALLSLALIAVGSLDKKLSQNEKEDINSLFNLSEYGQLLKVIGKMMGAEESKKSAAVEFVAM